MLTSKTSVVGSDDPHLFVCILSLRSTFYLFIGMILSQSHLFKQQNCCLHSGNQLVSGYQWWYHLLDLYGRNYPLWIWSCSFLYKKDTFDLQEPRFSSKSPDFVWIPKDSKDNHPHHFKSSRGAPNFCPTCGWSSFANDTPVASCRGRGAINKLKGIWDVYDTQYMCIYNVSVCRI